MLKVDNLEVAYGNIKAIKGISLEVNEGEIVTLIGSNGAGKSTVFQLMLRFFEAQSGNILFDGVDISQLDPVALRRHIAVVAQEPLVMHREVMELPIQAEVVEEDPHIIVETMLVVLVVRVLSMFPFLLQITQVLLQVLLQ